MGERTVSSSCWAGNLAHPIGHRPGVDLAHTLSRCESPVWGLAAVTVLDPPPRHKEAADKRRMQLEGVCPSLLFDLVAISRKS